MSIRKALKLVNESKDIKGTIAEKYLKETRGIDQDKWPKDIKFHEGVYSKVNKGRNPALLVIARDKDDKVQSVQAIYLGKDTAKKAEVEVQKQTFGSPKGALFLAGSDNVSCKTAVICEGAEDALSIFKSTTNKDIYACMGKSNFNNLSQEKLDKYDKIIIALDNDGKKPSEMPDILNVAARLRAQGKEVVLAQPNVIKQDYNDTLKLKGEAEVKSILSNGKSLDEIKTIKDEKTSKEGVKSMEKEI